MAKNKLFLLLIAAILSGTPFVRLLKSVAVDYKYNLVMY